MLGWLRKRIEQKELHSSLSSAFLKIKEDLTLQKNFIEDLHKNHSHLKDNTSVNHQRIAEWIIHFDKSIKRLEKDLLTLENKIYADLATMVVDSSKKLEGSLHAHKAELHTLKEVLKEELKRDLLVFVEDSKLKRASEPVINVDNVDNVNNITSEASFEALSNPEKWLVGVLFNTEAPLSYAQIAERTGKSISTVRVYMNQLKIKGFVEESSLPNGVKIFSLKHKAKVKKLYNL
ncbi:winged helix-turn-helix domain-containing protein [Candidatus Woesearchaeota archaeon]|nr:winged helix-turn-helix domain-containing protein [Candidatus Woesearchaeota archaeon]